MIPSYTTVIGVDQNHLEQLRLVWETWKRNKPSLLKHPMVIFYDGKSCCPQQIREIVDHSNSCIVRWPITILGENYIFSGDNHNKWSNPQRHKMLAGFVHVPRMWVETPYWLKIDLDVVAMEQDDWIDENWFKDNPAIICPSWNYTKPADQMLKLDEWSHTFPIQDSFRLTKDLNLVPSPGSDKVVHKRIISYVGFFRTDFTRRCSELCNGELGLPVPSQDGYCWYVAQRMNESIVHFNAKRLGWEWWHTEHNVRKSVQEALK